MVGIPGFRELANEQGVVIKLATALTAVSVLALVATFGLLYLLLRHEVYFPGGKLRANEISDVYLLEWAETAVHERYTWSYRDMERAQLRFLARLHPELSQDYHKKVMKEEQKLARDWEMASGIVLVQSWIVERDGLNAHVKVRVIRHRWVGGTPDADEMTVDMVLVPLIEGGWPTDVKIYAWSDDQPLKVTGQKTGQRR